MDISKVQKGVAISREMPQDRKNHARARGMKEASVGHSSGKGSGWGWGPELGREVPVPRSMAQVKPVMMTKRRHTQKGRHRP